MDTSEPSVQRFHRYTRPKRRYLLMLLVVSAINGFLARFIPDDLYLASAVAVGIVFVVAMINWAKIDADEHQTPLPHRFVPLMAICPGPLIMMPLHFIRTRGWSGGSLACLKSVAFFVVMSVADFIGSWLSEWLPIV